MRNVLEVDYGGNILTISVYGMFRRKLILSIGLKKIIVNWEKVRPIGLEGASSKALKP